MKTPICEFVEEYCARETLRMHMPGHKGMSLLGMEDRDITEIGGADSLYEAEGIILESERNAAELFGSRDSFYSTEGSSHCIRAMLALTLQHAGRIGKKPLILAARNAHKTFVTAAGLLDLDVEWLMPNEGSYLSCSLSPEGLEHAILACDPVAVYLTSPDYLGNCADLSQLAKVCKRHGVLLLVDNAHGAYLKFLPQSLHPLDLGADLCCDSAHKTLPALTGAAYLHISLSAPDFMTSAARDALALFGSTSPSYLILQSLDAVNAYLDGGYRQKLNDFLPHVDALKKELRRHGYPLAGNEPMKLTLMPKAYGYTGTELSETLEKLGVVCEFADPDFAVLMLSVEQGLNGLDRLRNALLQIPPKAPVLVFPPKMPLPSRHTSIRKAMLAPRERIPVSKARGRVLAALNVACPPAVPIAVCGEVLDEKAIALFQYYGITHCDVMQE